MTTGAGSALAATPQEILESHFTLVSQPGAIEVFDIDGADGWTSPNPHPALSLARWTTVDKDKAELALDQIVERFQEAGRGFDWMTGPRCVEHELVPLLKERGFIGAPLDVAAMARPIPSEIVASPPDGVRVWKVEDPKDQRIWSIMAKGFDVSDDVGEVFHNAYLNRSSRQYSEVYAAALDDNNEPIAVGYLSYIGDGPSILLRVSTTHEGSRGRGAYRALVTRRLLDAAKAGRTQAFVHAYSAGSRRGLGDLGFETVGNLQLHRWRP